MDFLKAFKKDNKKNSKKPICTCEKTHLANSRDTCFILCDICSERNFLKKSSSPTVSSSDTSSFGDE